MREPYSPFECATSHNSQALDVPVPKQTSTSLSLCRGHRMDPSATSGSPGSQSGADGEDNQSRKQDKDVSHIEPGHHEVSHHQSSASDNATVSPSPSSPSSTTLSKPPQSEANAPVSFDSKHTTSWGDSLATAQLSPVPDTKSDHHAFSPPGTQAATLNSSASTNDAIARPKSKKAKSSAADTSSSSTDACDALITDMTFPCPCKGCTATFAVITELRGHLRTAHPDDTRWELCDICCSLFMSAKELLSHVEEEHQSRNHKGKLECRTCHKVFNRRDRLRAHLRTHKGEKPYKCNMCDKAFSRRDRLKTHIKLKHLRSESGLSNPSSGASDPASESTAASSQLPKAGKSVTATKQFWSRPLSSGAQSANSASVAQPAAYNIVQSVRYHQQRQSYPQPSVVSTMHRSTSGVLQVRPGMMPQASLPPTNIRPSSNLRHMQPVITHQSLHHTTGHGLNSPKLIIIDTSSQSPKSPSSSSSRPVLRQRATATASSMHHSSMQPSVQRQQFPVTGALPLNSMPGPAGNAAGGYLAVPYHSSFVDQSRHPHVPMYHAAQAYGPQPMFVHLQPSYACAHHMAPPFAQHTQGWQGAAAATTSTTSTLVLDSSRSHYAQAQGHSPQLHSRNNGLYLASRNQHISLQPACEQSNRAGK